MCGVKRYWVARSSAAFYWLCRRGWCLLPYQDFGVRCRYLKQAGISNCVPLYSVGWNYLSIWDTHFWHKCPYTIFIMNAFNPLQCVWRIENNRTWYCNSIACALVRTNSLTCLWKVFVYIPGLDVRAYLSWEWLHYFSHCWSWFWDSFHNTGLKVLRWTIVWN